MHKRAVVSSEGLLTACMCAKPRAYALYRPDFLTAAFAAGKASDAKAMLPWSMVPWDVDASDSGGFGFGPTDVSFQPVASAIKYQHDKVRGNADILASIPPHLQL